MRTMFVGPSGAGKTTLINTLLLDRNIANKTQTVDFRGEYVDTPGEYAEIPRFYQNCFISTQQADLVVVVLAADADREQIPQGWALAIPKPVIGVVSKIDSPQADIGKTITYLAHAGVQPPYYLVSARTGEGVKELKDAIRQRCSDIAKEVVR
ncbi:MAG: ethanolamine utilization protein EutP [Syntrophomonadaceae bacterium]|jgi:ethanolamine utilization protein EutP|nr:ethanolamine utilization protein EutP [Syntrophomonadaceae bacterium]